ncbi:hypothetical protein [Pseudoxanthomonas mexicana]|uniref:hypothetical protein n=1 Tax=Pseudoxanthomonas mexicana TaxID=128785 RepID=UPI00398B62FC
MMPLSLADELLSQLPPHRDVRWTAAGLGLDEASFHAVARRVLELETAGSIDVLDMGSGSNGGSRLDAICFVKRL